MQSEASSNSIIPYRQIGTFCLFSVTVSSIFIKTLILNCATPISIILYVLQFLLIRHSNLTLTTFFVNTTLGIKFMSDV